ncbi:Adenosine deaminase [Seminavis robusta]|uniref:Adenosine deaminase n=1 Tax=Seminavis robusta TaxID=568900 RepID=A0A9N8EY08_9STRA|nr:Adenosine deaminase [Seminavis robusta]|eukprot:Sro2226_g319800.1 Adenosine deaminase (406) ;mRNA; f:1189-2559
MTKSKEDDDKELYQFVASMPKVELHAHLNGCIREETLFDLARQKNVELPAKLFSLDHHTNNDDHVNSFMYNVKPRSLTDCFDMFAVIPKCVNDLASLERITREALQDFANHHVAYLELRSTPKRINQSLSKRQYVETILRVMKEFQEVEEERYQQQSTSTSSTETTTRLPMKCRFLVSIDRSGSVHEAQENADLAIEFSQQPNSLVVGMDIGGNPTKNDFTDFKPALSRARKAGLKTTVHCGEVPVAAGPDDTDPRLAKARDEVLAIFEFRPDRLGHALLLPESLRNELTTLQVPVESCPTSNVMTLELAKHMGGDLIHGLRQHPQLQYWLDDNYPISIGTDDPGVFNTDATQELVLLAKAQEGVTTETLKRIVLDSVNHAFCNVELKDQMKQLMGEFFATMEQV